MVDLRPLLYINFLMILLLVSAGFSPVEEIQQPVAGAAQEPEIKSGSRNDSQTRTESEPSTPFDEEQHAKVFAALEETEKAAFAEEAIFADEVEPFPNGQQGFSAINPTVDADQFEQLELAPTLKHQAPIAHEPLVQVEERPITTGTLVVRSNVNDDTVLVNGKPYGPTMLELNLTPGSYDIEVAKDGYRNWYSSVDIRRGSKKTLNARLEHYTRVEYQNGEWQHDIKTGEGHYIEEGTLEYNGSFVNGKFHGTGSVRYANGMKYQGLWFEGKMKGDGSLTTTTGDTYIGELDNNKFNGEGTLTKATGDIFTGFWIDSVLNGQGSQTTQGGLLYVGGFSDNLFHGSGSLTYPDGGHYEGSFSNGMFHGKGVETYANGKKYVGQFIDGLYHGKGEILNPNGSKITGTFKDGKAFGKATLTTAEGEVFTARSSEPGVCYRRKSYRATECPQLDGW